MARPRNTTLPPITASQARYILEKLIDEKKVSAADVRRHLGGMWQEMNFLEKRLSELRGATGNPVRRVKAAVRKARNRRKMTPEAQKSRALQGQYIGFLRQVPEGDRKRFQDIAKSQGREAAVAALRKRLGK